MALLPVKTAQFPPGFDESTEAVHEVLPLAILTAFIKARSAVVSRATTVPLVGAPRQCIVCCDNFT